MNIDLRHGDCIKVMKDIPDNSIDAIITSPPYNFDIDYNQYEDKKAWDDYFEWINAVCKECYRILKDDGRLMMNIQPSWSNYMPTHSIITTNILSLGFKWKSEILWEKNNYNCG